MERPGSHANSPASDGDLREAIIEGFLAQSAQWAGANHWSWDVLTTLLTDAPRLGWPILREIVSRAPDNVLEYLGAGPLEDLLSVRGFDAIAVVEAEALRSPKFRRALSSVYDVRMPAEVRNRWVAIVDDDRRALRDAGEPSAPPRHVEVRVEGRPPTRPGSTTADQVARRGTLLAAVRAAVAPDFEPWSTPVGIDIRVEAGPHGDHDASAGDVLAAVIEALARDRPAGLVPLDLSGECLYVTRSLVRNAQGFDVFSHRPAYTVSVLRMVSEQVQVISDPSSYEEAAAAGLQTDLP